jgi:hypothetical protein
MLGSRVAAGGLTVQRLGLLRHGLVVLRPEDVNAEAPEHRLEVAVHGIERRQAPMLRANLDARHPERTAGRLSRGLWRAVALSRGLGRPPSWGVRGAGLARQPSQDTAKAFVDRQYNEL